MEVIDPGHTYELQVLDSEVPDSEAVMLTFVKRVGEKYPWNDPDDPGAYPGTILQEVLRACTDRLRYVIRQGEYLGSDESESKEALDMLIDALHSLEIRAARLHAVPAPTRWESEFKEPCWKCGHVVCAVDCEGRKP